MGDKKDAGPAVERRGIMANGGYTPLCQPQL